MPPPVVAPFPAFASGGSRTCKGGEHEFINDQSAGVRRGFSTMTYPVPPSAPRAAPPVDPARPQPWDALLICMAAFVLVSIARTHSFVPGMNAIRPGLLLAGLSLVLYFAQSDRARALGHLKHPLSALMLFIVVWATVGAPFALVIGRSVSFLLDNLFRTGVFVILLAACVRDLHDVRRLLMTMSVGGMIYALFAALPAVVRSGVGAGGYDPNDSAMFIALTIPITVYFLIRERRLAFRLLFAVALLVCTVAMVRTDSRGGFLALAAVIVYTVFFFQGIKPVFRAATAGVIALVLAFAATGDFWDRMRSINDPEDYNYTADSGRKAIWARARGYMRANPVLGIGIANFPAAEGRSDIAMGRAEEGRGFKWSVAHSIWYTVGPELGFPGLAAFVGMFLTAALYLRRIGRLARASPYVAWLQDAGGMAAALLGSLVAIAVAGTFLSMAYHPMVWGVFALVLGLLKALRFQGVDVSRGWKPSAWVAPGGGSPVAAASAGPVPPGRRRNVAFAPGAYARGRTRRYG
jgi:putative inorganic carbon (hco3(-)) transporter